MTPAQRARAGHRAIAARCLVLWLVGAAACSAEIPTWALGPAVPGDQRDRDAVPATVIPLPALSLSRTRGTTIGALPVFLLRDAEGDVASILAPSITYNEHRRLTATARLHRFYSGGGRGRFDASISQRNDYRLRGRYEGPALRHPDLHLTARGVVEMSGRERFFGVGPDSELEDESNLSRALAEAETGLEYPVRPALALSLGLRAARGDVRRGIVGGVPDTARRFPEVAGLAGHRVVAPRASLRYDSRGDGGRAELGTEAALNAELSLRAFGSSAAFLRLLAEIHSYGRLYGDRAISAARVRAEHIEPLGSSEIPMLELSRLGGRDTLRGFARDRFADAASVLASYEVRVTLFRVRVAGAHVDGEVAPFADAGAVAPSAAALSPADLRASAGVGFRAATAAGVTGRLDLAASAESLSLHLTLGYPF